MMDNWFSIHKTGDLKALLVDPFPLEWFESLKENQRQGQSELLSDKLEILWLDLNQQYIEEFELSNHFKATMRKKKRIALNKLKLIRTGDKTLSLFIKRDEIALESMNNARSVITDGEQAGELEKYMGIRLKTEDMSVLEFYSRIRNMNKEAKKRNVTVKDKPGKRV